ncbi:radical SAM protein, partial [bacterium]|nr:radical SAM protein [bacterium]
MGNKAKTKNCSKTNRALFEQDTSFQGNMPLTLYFSLTGDTNGQVRLQEELFTRVAQDTFPFAETVVFHLQSAAGSSTRLARFRSIAESYKINIKTNEQPIPKEEQTKSSWLNSSVFICENGDVLVFDPASLPSIIVGNLHDSRLPDIWYGPLYELLRAALPKQSFNLPFDSLSFTDPQQIINHFPQSDSYEMHLESLDQIHAYEKTLALEQKELLQQARTKEAELESQFTTLSTSEREAARNKRLRSMFMPWAYKKSTRIKSMLGDRVDSFGLLASTFPFEKQIERDLNQALKGYGPEFMGNMPTLMELAVTYGCNLRCFMCDQVKQGEEQQRVMLRQQLDLQTYREMAEDLFPTLETMIIGVAGEPTLHPDFTEFVRLGYEYGVMMKLLTNGTILNAPKVADAAIRYLDEMYVSIDGCTKETFEKIRTRGKFDQVCKGLERINALRVEHPESPLKISVNFTLMKDNIDEFPGMFAFAKKYGIHRVMADHLIVTTPEIQDKSLFNDKELCDKRLLEA